MNNDPIYTNQFVSQLEAVWGQGYLSPGGSDEVVQIFRGVNVRGAHVLDIGCGSGGPAITIVNVLNADRVTAIDIESQVIDRARTNLVNAGLDGIVDLVEVVPDRLPFEDNTFDIVFSKDSMIHIADKQSYYAEVLRVLAPGGTFVFSDWLCGEDASQSLEFQRFNSLINMHFTWQTASEAITQLTTVGFQHVKVRDRNKWYAETAKKDAELIIGDCREQILSFTDEATLERMYSVRSANAAAAGAGALRPTHFQCLKHESWLCTHIS